MYKRDNCDANNVAVVFLMTEALLEGTFTRKSKKILFLFGFMLDFSYLCTRFYALLVNNIV